MALDDALKALAAIDPRQSQVVELRFFGGLRRDRRGVEGLNQDRDARLEIGQGLAVAGDEW